MGLQEWLEEVVGGQEKKAPTHNHAFSIADGKVDDNMTIVL